MGRFLKAWAKARAKAKAKAKAKAMAATARAAEWTVHFRNLAGECRSMTLASWVQPSRMSVGMLAHMFGYNILVVGAHVGVQLVVGGQVLNPDLPLSAYNIQHETTLDYVLRSVVTLYIQCDRHGGDFTLDVEASETIDNVKAQLQGILRIPPHRQRLTFADRLLEDGSTLADYNIPPFAMITVTRI